MGQNETSGHILIIDDSPDAQALLTILLQSRGYKIDCTSNGEEALRLLQSSNELPDVILLDLRMPIMDGFDFLELQRENPRIKDIPIVIMSGDEDIELTRAKTHVADILLKPLHISSIIEAVERNSHLH